uniref:CARD domain-containing protein n=1 Tax=Plectus sambesii TaxID=2011161 RepID=A0A914V7S5_9BILA
MSDAEHQILNLAAKKLKQCLDVDGILMSLVSAEVISHEDSMRIRAAPSFDRCTALLDVLYRKENFLNVFLYTLIESNQSHIVEHINEFLPTVHLPPIDIQATKTARLHESAARVSAANTPSFLRFKKGDEFHDAELKIHDVEFAPDEVDNLVVHGGLLGKDIGTYDYNRDQRKARILMINNIKFDYAEDRLGADKDKESLGILCEKVFPGIKPMYHENKKAHEMEQVLKKFADLFLRA